MIQTSKPYYITNLIPITICGDSRTWCETKETDRSQTELDGVTTAKNETPIRQSEATDVTPVSQQFLLDLQTKWGRLKQI